MFCSKCGNLLIEGALFCQKCGAKVNNEGTESAEAVREKVSGDRPPSEENILHQTDEAVNDGNAEGEFDVTLLKTGSLEGYVIAAVRDWFGFPLHKAAKVVKKTPVLLKKGISREEAEKLKAGFMEVGATLGFTDQRGKSVNIVLHCRSCGAALDNVHTVCSSCGSAFKVTPPYKMEAAKKYIMKLNCFDRREFQEKLVSEISEAYINQIYDEMILSARGSMPMLYLIIFGLALSVFILVIGLVGLILPNAPIVFIFLMALGYIYYQLRGAKWVTSIYYSALSKGLLLPEGMTFQTLVTALNGKFDYPYFKGARCSIEGECLIEGRYSVYSVIFSENHIPQLTCNTSEEDKKYRIILREAIAIRSYINRFFAPTSWKDVEKDLKALKLAEKQQKIVVVASSCTTLIITIAFLLNVIGAYIPGGASRIFQPGMEVRNAYLTQYSDKITIEEAFDNFFENVKWSKYKEAGYTYVVFTGACEYMGERADMRITFKITGENFIVDNLDVNGRAQNDYILHALLLTVYEDY